MYGRIHRMKRMVNRCITEQGRRKRDAEEKKKKRTYGTKRRTLKELKERAE